MKRDKGGRFTGRVKNSDPEFVLHDTAGRGIKFLAEYNSSFIAADRRTAYKSEKYPWIEMAGHYQILAGSPLDMDALSVDIPGRKGPGGPRASVFLWLRAGLLLLPCWIALPD